MTNDGQFVTEVKNDEKRFAMALSGLSAGRLSLAFYSPVSFNYLKE